MSTNNVYTSDLYRIHNIVQSSMLVYPKEIVIATLRDFFSKDSYYHYSKDQWGFPNTTDHTNLPLGADIPYGVGAKPELSPTSILSTRLYIGENYRYDGIYYPAILVKSNSWKYAPLSFTREKGGIMYENTLFEDGYGNQTVISKPASLITAGAWEGSLSVDVLAKSIRARDDLVELIAICFTDIRFEELVDVGIVIKPVGIGAPSESDDRNDKLFRQTITLDIRTEWRREIPILSVIDAISFAATFVNVNSPDTPMSPNLDINTEVNLLDMLIKT